MIRGLAEAVAVGVAVFLTAAVCLAALFIWLWKVFGPRQ